MEPTDKPQVHLEPGATEPFYGSQNHGAFMARGAAAIQHYLETKESYSADEVLAELKAMTAAKRGSITS